MATRKAGKGTWVVTGIKGLDKALKALPAKIEKKVLRQAMRKGVKPIQAAAKANVPVRSGTLKKAIKVRAMKRKKDRLGVLVIVGQGDFKGETFYGAMIEYGHFAGKRGTPDRKFVEAKPFMRPAFETNKEAVGKETVRLIREGVENEVKGLKVK